MHILFLTQIIPYPLDAGPKVKTWHVLRYLAQLGYQVTLASFVRPEEEQYVPVLEEVCHEVFTVPIKRSRLSDVLYWLRSNFTGRPFLVERDDLEGMRKLVADILSREYIDVIHADKLTMAQFGLSPKPDLLYTLDKNTVGNLPYRIFDAHNAVWTIVDRMKENAPWYLKPIAGLETNRIKRYEGKVVSEFDHTLAVAEPDRLALNEAVATFSQNRGEYGNSITVVPIAVDTQSLQPVNRSGSSKNIVTLGTLHYPPNADGIRWFANEVFPLVLAQEPAATLTIIGKNPPPDFLKLQERFPGNIEVTGYVEDLTPYFEQAAISVIAVRAGGGMRVRILEAFARGMPLVTTTIGLEGIDAEPGNQVLVKDSPEDFAAGVLQLLHDPRLASKMAENGRRLAEQVYDWQVVLSQMDEVYKHAPKIRGGRNV